MISSTGYWNYQVEEMPEVHKHDVALGLEIIQLANHYKPELIYDFGCGAGFYVKQLNDAGFKTIGFDGNPSTNQIENCRVQDLTDTDCIMEKVNFLVSLELGEHIPKKLEDNFITNLDKNLNTNGLLILSWAIKGQSGIGHVNCQNNDYIISKFTSMGYTYHVNLSKKLRKSSTLPWFKNTIMVFTK